MKIVVIGGGAAGLAAATRAKRVAPNAEIVVVEATSEFSRGTCSLPYLLSNEIPDPSQLFGVDREGLEARGITLYTETRALHLHPMKKIVETDDRTFHYDKLIVSTGSRPFVPFPVNTDTVWSMRTVADVIKIREDIKHKHPQRVAVIGGGYVGVELAEALVELGIEPTIFHRAPTLMRLHPTIGGPLRTYLEGNGIVVQTGCSVESVEAGRVTFVRSGQKSESELFDAVALCVGVIPEVTLLREAGAVLGRSGAVVVNSRGETSLSNVYACGDGVEIPNPRGGANRWVPLATTAARLGRVCGENAAGGSMRLGANLGSIVVRLFNRQLGMVGQPDDWQKCEPFEFTWGSEPAHFERRRRGWGVFYISPRTERICGVQLFGPEVAGMVDLAAFAIEADLTVPDLLNQDFSYHPPLSGLWHPFYLAARTYEKKKHDPRMKLTHDE